jgi:hypothetical protein
MTGSGIDLRARSPLTVHQKERHLTNIKLCQCRVTARQLHHDHSQLGTTKGALVSNQIVRNMLIIRTNNIMLHDNHMD